VLWLHFLLQPQVGALNDEQIEFITSGAALKFIPQQQLEHELGTRGADSLQTFVSALMSLSDEMGYDPERDMGATPLNIASKRFNKGKLPTPAPLRDLEREQWPVLPSEHPRTSEP
jgi:hypothetical protein